MRNRPITEIVLLCDECEYNATITKEKNGSITIEPCKCVLGDTNV